MRPARVPRIVLLASLLGGGLAAQGVPSATARSDSARMQGAWLMVSGAADGIPMPAALLGSMRRVLNGDSLLVTMNGQVYFRAVIQLAAAETPKTIDYHMTDGFSPGAIQRGIYRFAGDTVVFCFGAPDAVRPTEFKTVPGDRRTLAAWLPVRP